MKLAWGAKVSPEFARKAICVANEIGSNPSELMSCMAFESMETFSPSVCNHASGATGVIQFMRPTAKGLGTTTAELARMSAVRQLDYVAAYFKPYRGKLKSIDDLYMAILWPLAVGKPSSYVLFDKSSTKTQRAYFQNKGLDADKDGQVTKAEAAAQVRAKLRKGLGAGYAAEISGDDTAYEPDDRGTQDITTDNRARTRMMQRNLRTLTYYRGIIDGGFGGKMAAAIAGFLTDWDERDADIAPPKSTAEYDEIIDALESEVSYAISAGFKRPVTKAREEADPEIVKEIAPSTIPQRRGIIASVWGAIVTAVSGFIHATGDYIATAWNWVTGARDQLPDAVSDPGWLSWAFDKLGSLPASIWLFVGAGVLAFVAFGLIKAVKMQVDDVRTGKL